MIPDDSWGRVSPIADERPLLERKLSIDDVSQTNTGLDIKKAFFSIICFSN